VGAHASYYGDPWLGTSGKTGKQEVYWSWRIPQSWMNGPLTPARIFIVNVYKLPLSNLSVVRIPAAAASPLVHRQVRQSIADQNTKPPDPPISPVKVGRWYAHASLLAAIWGDNRTMSPISPSTQTYWVEPNVTDFTEDDWPTLLSSAVKAEKGLEPPVIADFWEAGEHGLEALVKSQPHALWPVHAQALKPQEESICDKYPLFIMGDPTPQTIAAEIPRCAPDFTSSITQAVGLTVEGDKPFVMSEPWTTQTLLAGSIAHLVSIRPSEQPTFYAHLLRITAKNIEPSQWSFGNPQLAEAAQLVLHHRVPAFQALPVRYLKDVTYLTASTSTDVQSVELKSVGPHGGAARCRHNPSGAIRCVIPHAYKAEDAIKFEALVTYVDDKKKLQKTISWKPTAEVASPTPASKSPGKRVLPARKPK
jgi:hypothetical protein